MRRRIDPVHATLFAFQTCGVVYYAHERVYWMAAFCLMWAAFAVAGLVYCWRYR